MRILALVTDAFGGFGGIARYNQDVFTALASNEAVRQIVIVPRTGADTIGATPAKITEISPVKNRVLYVLRSLAIALFDGPFDAIWCGHLHLASLCSAIARIKKIPFWLQIYGIEAWRGPLRRRNQSFLNAHRVISISRHTRRKFLSWAGTPPERVVVLPNALDAKYRPSGKSDALLNRLGLTDKRVLLTVGRLSAEERYKGHERIIKLLPILSAEFTNLSYLIVGTGDDKPRLEQIATTLGVAKSVVFAGAAPDGDLADFYNSADAFAMPSTGEGFGFVFLDAAACGLPVLGGNLDGSVDALRDGDIGVLTNPDDDADLLDGLRRILRTHRTTSPAPALSVFSMNNFTSHVHALLRTVRSHE